MNDTQARLTKCFSAVFPQLSEREISSASMETLEAWDSIASITLVTVIEEEFSVQFEPTVLDHFVSFRSILDYLTGLLAAR
ncbi:MAG: acyl carrier protein [Candidatus Acidiferrales bacterium]